jgi:hypothetical protein
MSKPVISNLRQQNVERQARASVASRLGCQRRAVASAYQAENEARDERAELLSAAVGGCLKSQVRCTQLYGKGWQYLAAGVLALGPKQQENF